MAEFIGNCNDIINWDKVIQDCENNAAEYTGPGKGMDNPLPELQEIRDIWSKWYTRYDQGGTVAWDMFFPGKQWENNVAQRFWDFVGISQPSSIWISRIYPGCFAPIHWDVQSDEYNYKSENEHLYYRYHAHITDPKFGHFFVVDDTPFYNEEKGNVYQWNSRKSWHAGTNCGLEPKYILNAFGKK